MSLTLGYFASSVGAKLRTSNNGSETYNDLKINHFQVIFKGFPVLLTMVHQNFEEICLVGKSSPRGVLMKRYSENALL